MKHNERKPRSGTAAKSKGAVRSGDGRKAAGKKNRPPKKKKGKKLLTSDKLRVVLVTAVLIMSVSAVSLFLVYYHSGKQFPSSAQTSSVQTPSAQAPAEQLPPEEEPITPVPPAPIGETAAPAENSTQAVQRPVQAEPNPDRNSVGTRPESRPAETRPEPTASLPPAGAAPAGVVPAGIPEKPPSVSMGTLAFVIDDAGNNLRDLEPFLKFPGALTIAVLPGLPYSAEAARRIRSAGKEVFLHQPMEALGNHNPGPGAIMAGMSKEEIRVIVSRNLDEIGPVAGINNHEGSRITMDEETMETILSLCRERGIVFLDSRTTAETVAPEIARRLGMTIGERDVFIDNIQERDSMLEFINTGLRKAERNGSAIMIGHTWSPELAPLLSELYSDYINRGYSFSRASALIH